MINNHRELSDFIKDKSILHLLSLGKDSIVCLDWLVNYAKCKRIVSVYYRLESGFPTDEKYIRYLQRNYKNVTFVSVINHIELAQISNGRFQFPTVTSHVFNNLDYDGFDTNRYNEDLRKLYKCDYVCSGLSKYEGMGRAIYLKKNGLVNEKRKAIYPIGLFNQKQVFQVIKKMKVRMNPSYKYSAESFDTPTYLKMKYAFDRVPEFEKNVLKIFPLLELDKYRWERLINVENK